MKGKILLASLITACLLTSGGYGYWQKEITIRGEIVAVPEPPPPPAPPLSVKLTVKQNDIKSSEGENQKGSKPTEPTIEIEVIREGTTNSPSDGGDTVSNPDTSTNEQNNISSPVGENQNGSNSAEPTSETKDIGEGKTDNLSNGGDTLSK